MYFANKMTIADDHSLCNNAAGGGDNGEPEEVGFEFPLFENDGFDKGEVDHKYDQMEHYRNRPLASMLENVIWSNVIILGTIHLVGLYGMCRLTSIYLQTCIFLHVLNCLCGMGLQAGAHRYYSHRSYKANTGVQIFLMLCHTMSLQNSLYQWVRDHRIHHKFSETDADPHNIKRGIFFAHCGWLLMNKHPDVVARGRQIDVSDLRSDPIVMFQRRYYAPLFLVFWGLIPAMIPVYGWGESWSNSILVCVFFRYVLVLNITWLSNSCAHHWGVRPYDIRLGATECAVRHLLMGDGFHNYHHAFPWDYSTSEFGINKVFNPVTATIDLFAWSGWAWDLKKVSASLVERKKAQEGVDLLDYSSYSGVYEWVSGVASVMAPITVVQCILLLLVK